MSFSSFHLHPSLTAGLKDLGFVRPTPIQADAIPPGLEGRDILACAMTGSGKTAAFLLPILHQLIPAKRGATRALVLTPTRELAAQIVEDLNDLATHAPVSGAAVFGGVGMGPQEHAFRTGVDVIVATPGRLLDHFKRPYAKLSELKFLVLDEADRMLDMGFLPDIRRVLKHLPTKRQTLFFSATMPAPIQALSREMLRDPVMINLARKSAPAVGITQAVYPVSQKLKADLLLTLLKRGLMQEALVFTRTKHRANRVAEFLVKGGIDAERIHGNRSQSQRTAALEGFKNGRFRVLVATDIAARGIDVEELGHVVNFDVPLVPEDYIHRVGRTARAEATGDAFTFVAPEEESELKAIEKAVGKRLPRVTVPDFDYQARPEKALEIPLAERLAAMRAQRGTARGRPAHKSAGRGGAAGQSGRGSGSGHGGARGGGRPAHGSAPSRRAATLPDAAALERRSKPLTAASERRANAPPAGTERRPHSPPQQERRPHPPATGSGSRRDAIPASRETGRSGPAPRRDENPHQRRTPGNGNGGAREGRSDRGAPPASRDARSDRGAPPAERTPERRDRWRRRP